MTTSTHDIETPAGNKFILNNFITYGQHRELTAVYLSEKPAGELAAEADKKGMEMVIVSINGKTENIYEEFKKLPFTDVQQVIKTVKETLSPKV